MPAMSNKNNTQKNNETNEVIKNEDVVISKDNADEIETLKSMNENLTNQIQNILKMLETQTAKTTPVSVQIPEKKFVEQEEVEDFEEPSPNKNIKIISLFYGDLNLSDGNSFKLNFTKYGQSKNCLYSKLIDIVNTNLKFAQEGKFYISDKSAVYHLGLSDVYRKIQPKEILDNICDYDDASIDTIGKSLTRSQIEELSYGLATRIYNGEKFDLNKINLVSKAIGKDINALVTEIRTTEGNNNE